MEEFITWVGIDAHKKTLAVAAFQRPGQEPEEFTIDNDERAIRKLVRRLERDGDGREIRICYEAGTCGYALQRRLEATGGVVCEVIAPSLVPRKPGERIKTDRRDARKLAELYRAGVLTTVAPPSPEQEAIRDLCRCREDVRADLGRCRHRLVKMLVRRGHVFNTASRLWGTAHRDWLRSLVFDNDVDRAVVTEYTLAVEQAERRLHAMDNEIAKAAQLPLYREHVAWLRCFRGIDTKRRRPARRSRGRRRVGRWAPASSAEGAACRRARSRGWVSPDTSWARLPGAGGRGTTRATYCSTDSTTRHSTSTPADRRRARRLWRADRASPGGSLERGEPGALSPT